MLKPFDISFCELSRKLTFENVCHVAGDLCGAEDDLQHDGNAQKSAQLFQMSGRVYMYAYAYMGKCTHNYKHTCAHENKYI